jgi:hypothetical protein
MGPVWDYDLAFGNSTLYAGLSTNGWRFKMSESKNPYHFPAPTWWSLLLEKPQFKLAVKKRWLNLRQNLLSIHNINSTVDSLSRTIPNSLNHNFRLYKVIGKRIQWAAPPQKNYTDELLYLKNYMIERAKWMDGKLYDFN